MKPMTAHDLKNSTREVVRALKRGESILLTFRGKPLDAIVPLQAGDQEAASIRPFEVAWTEIEAQLRQAKPRFASGQQAEAES
jgi:prevent-host-death family protein